MPLKLKWGWKLLLAALLAVAAFKFHLLHLFGGPMFFSPVLPETFCCGRVAVLRSFPVLFLLLAADVVRALYLLVLFCLRRNRTERFRIIGNRVNVALLVFPPCWQLWA